MELVIGWRAGTEQKDWVQPANQLGLGPVRPEMDIPGPLKEAIKEADERLKNQLKLSDEILGDFVITQPENESEAIMGVEVNFEALMGTFDKPVTVDDELIDRVWDVKDELREDFDVFYHAEPFLSS